MDKSKVFTAWWLVKAYWVSEEKWAARGLLALVIALDMLIVYRGARVSFWQKDFYDALSKMDTDAFWRLLVELMVISVAQIVMDISRIYTAQTLKINWRAWMTDVFTRRWLADHSFYRIERLKSTENLDQRIAEDLRLLTTDFLELGLGLLSNLVNLVTFAIILWGLSGILSFALAGYNIEIPGYMLWAALIYAVVGSFAMEKFGAQMAAIDYKQQRAEADFRFLLVRVRESAEQIAFYGGQQAEQIRLKHRFDAIRQNWRHIITYTKRISVVDSLYTDIGALVPYAINVPRYFAGLITLGDVVQLQNSFMRVRVSLSWFIYRYERIAMMRSVFSRLIEFEHALQNKTRPAHAPAPVPQIARQTVAREGILIDGAQACREDGAPLMQAVRWHIQPGQHWLLRGPSGAGKSTLLRVLAGLWTEGHGRVEWPEGIRAMFVPQQSYLPIDTLRACLNYPSAAGAFHDDDCREALRWARLEHLAASLDEEDHWARRLSPGEQQRLAFARVVLQKPDYLFLDEATASLDEETEAVLYSQLAQRLPALTLVSVAHRSSLRRFHTHVLDIEPLRQTPAPGPAHEPETALESIAETLAETVVETNKSAAPPLRILPETRWRPT